MSKDELTLPRKINASNPATFARTAEEHSSDTFNILSKMKARLEKAASDVASLEADLATLQSAFGGILATVIPREIDANDLGLIGTSTRAAREDHQHDVNTGAPSQGIGGANSEGVSASLARADHDHLLRETSGPTDISLGGILDGDSIRRVGGALLGRQLSAVSNNLAAGGSATALADVSSGLNHVLVPGAYVAIWVLAYTTAGPGNGLMLSINYSGTFTNTRYGVLTATNATTMYSASENVALDVPLGNATVGPGTGTSRLAIMFARFGAVTAGTLALRFASGVAGQAVSIGARGFGLLLQQ